jgi:Family of unknown function (DUF5701)
MTDIAASPSTTSVIIDAEFDRQRDRLLALGYPRLAGRSEEKFAAWLEPLRVHARSVPFGTDLPPGQVPFAIVVTAIKAADLVPLLRLHGGTEPGILDRNHGEAGLTPYRPLPELRVPAARAYLLVDVQRGEEFCGVRPVDAVQVIAGRGRTPITILEGIALVTLFPALLERNKCMMLAGSRRGDGDRRVPAVWISGAAPKLGWCWEGNPHTWLGTASAGRRLG